MTRVNIVPVSELMDQHLVAEYRELLMVPASLKRSLKGKLDIIPRIPKSYTLGKGHVLFFMDKGLYLDKRYQELIAEMKSRGMKPDPNRVFPKDAFPKEFYNDWAPTEQDLAIIRARIKEKISMKPDWYRYSKNIT
jgi:deoxyribonuclease (pyrimidine dimer)